MMYSVSAERNTDLIFEFSYFFEYSLAFPFVNLQ